MERTHPVPGIIFDRHFGCVYSNLQYLEFAVYKNNIYSTIPTTSINGDRKELSLKTKFRVFNTNGETDLLYETET